MYKLYLILVIILYSNSPDIFVQILDEVETKTTIGGYGELHYNNEKISDQP